MARACGRAERVRRVPIAEQQRAVGVGLDAEGDAKKVAQEAQAADAALAELTAGARNVSIANVSGAAFARDDVAPVALEETKRSSSRANTGVFDTVQK